MFRVDQPTNRVLVVDDEQNITELIATAMRYEGFDVETAATGRKALEAIAAFRPHLILLDVMLPDLDGFEVARRVRQEGRRVPIVFLTAKDATEDKVRGLTLGGDDYVSKPFSLEELLARVRAVLRRVVSKAQILDHVWEYDFGGDANVVETYISYLRKKVDADGPALIHTIRGAGYSLRVPATA